MKTAKNIRGKMRKGFSLIELMIVIVIIGALTAIILPQFDVSEAEAKDAGCDASNYGTLRQLTNYRSVNGVYPSGMHTCCEDLAATNLMGHSTDSKYAALADVTYHNLTDGSSAIELVDAENEEIATSLREAGMINVACGGFATEGGAQVEFGIVGTAGTFAREVDDFWYETYQKGVDGKVPADKNSASLDKSTQPVTVNGIPMHLYAYAKPNEASFALGATGATATVAKAGDQNGVVIVLSLAPTADWAHWYDADGNENDSKIQVAQAGQCPWLEAGAEFRYYLAFFKAFNDGSKAKLIGTACPECGSLNP